MKLSIIIPVYNVADFLPQTIRSVLAQTHREFELILVDDGATDGSGQICDQFANQDSRVRVIHQKNAGVSAARNAGLDAATGDYIGWVDSDDIVEADMFAVMLALAQREQADVVQCQHDRADTCNSAVRSQQVTYLDGPAFVRRMFTKTGGDYTNQVALCSKIYRRSLWGALRFPVGQVYEDEMQTYKVCLAAKNIVETPDVLYHYIKRDNSIITGESPRKMLDKQLALADRLHYLPPVLPDLEEACAGSFLNFSKDILCRLYAQGEGDALQQGIRVLLEEKKHLQPWLNRYDKLYLPALKWAKRWVLGNEFTPIQNMVAKIRRAS